MTRQVPTGPRLRAARLSKGLTLEAVAIAAGVTQGFISRLERDQVSPSVATLVAICDAVGLRVGDLFEAPPTQVVRVGQGAPINFGGRGAQECLLTPSNETHVQVIHSVIGPTGSAGPDLYVLDCDTEFVYFLRGFLQLIVGAEMTALEAGDAMTFRGWDPHTWRNASTDVDCEVLWVLAPAP